MGCEQRRFERKRRSVSESESKGLALSEMSSHGDMRDETAKFLPACKTVSSTTFVLKSKVALGVSLEMAGNSHPR